MSKFYMSYRVSESVLDNNGNIVADYDSNLPHHDFIKEKMTKSWNDMHMERFFDGVLKDKIESCLMRFCQTTDGYSVAMVETIGVPGFRFTEKRRNEIAEQLEAQFCDGWGEGFFGYVNVMTAPDGKKIIVE